MEKAGCELTSAVEVMINSRLAIGNLPLALRGGGDAVVKNAAGNFDADASQVLTTVGTGHQMRLTGRLTF